MRVGSPDLDVLARRVVMGSFAGPDLPPWLARMLDGGLGSVCLFGSNVGTDGDLARLTADLHARSPHLLVATDEEGGDVTRLHHADGSPYPGNAALGAVDDVGLTELVARAIGAELRAAGVDLDLAPVVDIASDPRNPVVGVRSFGADPGLVSRHAAAYVAGLQSAGVGACVKHFPGHGDTAVDSHHALPVVAASPATLRERELVPFAAAVAAGTLAVMAGHLLLPALDRRLPATVSPTVVAVLRDELGFDGLLVSDALDMRGAGRLGDVPAIAVRALAAGCDLVCLGADKDAELHLAVVAAVVDAVRSGVLPETRLVAAAGRVERASEHARRLRAAATATAPDGEAAGRAARAAIRVTGTPPPLRGATVLRFVTSRSPVADGTPWGLPLDGSVCGERVDVVEDDPVRRLVSPAAERPVVALVRDAARHPWVLDRLRAIAAARPDLVTVEMGWPGDVPLPGASVVSTYGAGRVTGDALETMLSGGTR